MNKGGFDFLSDPFSKGLYECLRTRVYISIKSKTTLLVQKGARLLGVIDESGILDENEVFVTYSISDGRDETDRQVVEAEKVLVTRNPCLHPGDIRVIKPRSDQQAKEAFSHLNNVIVFPSKGKNSLPSEMAGGDLDGDIYFVSWDSRIIPEEPFPPMGTFELPPLENNPNEKETVTPDDVIAFFVEYVSTESLGRIANSHLAVADLNNQDIARSKQCLALAEAH